MTQVILTKDEMNVTDPTLHDDFQGDLFDPANYNKTYYSEVMQDEAALVTWQATTLHQRLTDHLQARGVARFSHQFDAGSGPSVHHLFALEKYSDKIVLADFLPGNLEEIEKWLHGDPTAHNWEHFVDAILRAEGVDLDGMSATERTAAIAARQQAVRSKIVARPEGFLPLDLKETVPENYRAPLVTNFFVADSATDDKATFATMIANTFDIVEQGGIYVGAYLGGCKAYAVGDEWVNSADLYPEDVERALLDAGAVNVTVERFETPEMAPEGFEFVMTAIAEKQ